MLLAGEQISLGGAGGGALTGAALGSFIGMPV